MVFTPDMCACRWSVGENVIGTDGRITSKEVPTQTAKTKDIVEEVGLYRGGSGAVRIYNIFQSFNRHPGDFHDGDYYAQNRMYSMPDFYEDLMDDLAQLSLTHKITRVEHWEYGIDLVVMESTDGTTNIDADVIEAVVEAFKRKGKRRKKV